MERRDALVERIPCSLVEVVTALQVILVSFGIDWLRRCQTRPILGREADLDLLGDSPTDLLLHFKKASVFARVFFRPNVLVGCAPNQLCVNANPASLSYYRPFDNGVHPERSGNLWYRELRVLEAHHRRAGNDAQIADPREASNQSLGHPVSKVFLCRIAREVFQRQYCKGTDFGLPRIPCVTPDQDVSDGKQGEHRHPSHNQPKTRPRGPLWSVVTFRIHRCFRFVSFVFFLQAQFAALQPSIELGTERVDRAALVVDVAMNGHALALFPPADGRDVAP